MSFFPSSRGPAAAGPLGPPWARRGVQGPAADGAAMASGCPVAVAALMGAVVAVVVAVEGGKV